MRQNKDFCVCSLRTTVWKLRKLLSHFFGKNFVKPTVLVIELLNSWFDEIFFQWEWIFHFSTMCSSNKQRKGYPIPFQSVQFFFQLAKLIDTLEKQLTEKGQEINAYIEKHNIQVQGKKDRSDQMPSKEETAKPSTGVLVSPTEASKWFITFHHEWSIFFIPLRFMHCT